MMMNKNIKQLLIGEISFRRFVRSFLIIYLFFMIYVYFVSDSMMFLPHPAFYKDNNNILKIITDDGTPISAVYLESPGAGFTILYNHGNAEDIGDIQPLLEDFRAHGYSVIAYDYHGYGTSEGKSTEKNAYADIEAVYKYLIENKKVPPNKIIAVGFSLGNGPTTYLAEKYDLAGVVLQAPFITAFRVVTHIPILPFDRFRNIARIKHIKEPILIIHGTADELIPVQHGRKLYELANAPKSFLWVEEAGHFDIVDKAGQLYWDKLAIFTENL